MTTPLPVFVGESNPYGGDPRHALFPLPIGSAGHRLQTLVCGVRRSTYVGFPRYDLCAGKWSLPAARARGLEITGIHRDALIVMLGRKVAAAFGYAHLDFYTAVDDLGLVHIPHAPLRALRGDERFVRVLLPHPSGLCREWHKLGAFEHGRDLLRTVAPHIRWGELGGPIRGSEAPDPLACTNCGAFKSGNVCPECGEDQGETRAVR